MFLVRSEGSRQAKGCKPVRAGDPIEASPHIGQPDLGPFGDGPDLNGACHSSATWAAHVPPQKDPER